MKKMYTRTKKDGTGKRKPGRKPATDENRKTETTIYITAEHMKTGAIGGNILQARRLIYNALNQLK